MKINSWGERMEQAAAMNYMIDGIQVEEYRFKKTPASNWVFAIKHPEGIAEPGIQLLEKVRHRYGTFALAEMGCHEHSAYNYLKLTDEAGNELHLSGCTSGYRGTGPFGTYEVLKKLGFDIDRRMVLLKDTFTLYYPKSNLGTAI